MVKWLIDYKSIIEQLDTRKVIQLMETLGVVDYIEKPGYVIFPTICHILLLSSITFNSISRLILWQLNIFDYLT